MRMVSNQWNSFCLESRLVPSSDISCIAGDIFPYYGNSELVRGITNNIFLPFCAIPMHDTDYGENGLFCAYAYHAVLENPLSISPSKYSWMPRFRPYPTRPVGLGKVDFMADKNLSFNFSEQRRVIGGWLRSVDISRKDTENECRVRLYAWHDGQQSPLQIGSATLEAGENHKTIALGMPVCSASYLYYQADQSDVMVWPLWLHSSSELYVGYRIHWLPECFNAVKNFCETYGSN